MKSITTSIDDIEKNTNDNAVAKNIPAKDVHTIDIESQMNESNDNVTTLHNTNQSSSVVSVNIIEMATKSDSVCEVNKKSRSWFGRKRQSAQLQYQVQHGQQQQLQRQPTSPGGHNYVAYQQQGYPQRGYPQNFAGQQLPPGYNPPSRNPQDGPYYNAPPYDPKTRNGFVARVMIIVFFMLACTAGFLVFVFMNPHIQAIFINYRALILIIGTVGLMIAYISFMCSACARKLPVNFVMLILTLYSMSCIAAVITSQHKTEIVMYAALATAGITLVCTILALTPFDFTRWTLYIVVIATGFSFLAIIVMAGMSISGQYLKPAHLAILIVSVLLQSVILALELQMIIGGKTIELGEDEWALAVFMLYTSIVDIFLKMVQILGLTN